MVACIVNQGTSGAYMAAIAADEIIALPTAIVGNVGVIMASLSLEGLLDKLGIDNQTITSGKYKDSGNPLRDMTEEDREIIKDIIMTDYEDFVAKVMAERPVTETDMQVVSDGRVFSAVKGLEYPLIDSIGYYEDALKKVQKMAAVTDPTVIMYRRLGEMEGGFYSWP